MNISSPNEPRLRDRLKEATRAAILDAAEAVIAVEGLDGARMEDIASRAGVAVGTVYNHFDDRSALREALLHARRETLLAQVDEVLDRTETTPFPEALEGFIRVVLEHFERHGAAFQLLLEEEIFRYRPGQPRVSTMRELVYRAERLTDRGVREGALRSDDRELLPTLLVSQIRGAVRYSMRTDPPSPMGPLTGAVARSFLQGSERRGA